MITLQIPDCRMLFLTINIPMPIVLYTLSAMMVVVMILLIIMRRNMLRMQRNAKAIIEKECEKARNQAHIGVLETVPMPIAVYDSTGKCIFLNSWCKKITSRSNTNETPDIFDSQILSKENCEKLKNGENVSADAFINYDNDELTIFGKKVDGKLAIRYTIQRVYTNDGKTFNYILAISDITHDYAQQQRTKDLQTLLSDCLQLTGIAAYIYDVARDKYYRFKGSDIIQLPFNAEYVFQHISPQYRGQYIEMFLRVKNGEISTDRRCYSLISSTNNKPYFVETFTYGTTDVSGKVTRILQTIRNVTENQEKLYELKSLKHILGKALPIAGIVAWRYDVSTHRFMRTNFAAFSNSSSFDEICANIHPDDRNKVIAAFNKLLQGEASNAHLTIRMALQNADWLSHEIFAIPMHNDIGSVSAIIGIRRDISEENEVENRLKEIRKKATALVEVAGIGLFVYNSIDKSLITYSHKTGRHPYDNVNRYIEMVHPDDKNIILDIFNKVDNQQIEDFRVRLKARANKNEEYRTVEFCGKAYEYNQNTPTNYIAFIKNV
ncbi:MAG: hypothetical protein ACI30V_06920 [Muribaculaceae bacterium]